MNVCIEEGYFGKILGYLENIHDKINLGDIDMACKSTSSIYI